MLPACSTFSPRAPVVVSNPVQIPGGNRDVLWDRIVDVVDDYFEIEREDRVRQVGDVLTVGRIDTHPINGATLLEPYRKDSATMYERLESTFQTIRRRAVVQVIPSDQGYLIEVAVYKELEDAPRPEYATTGSATLRHDTTLRGEQDIVGGQATNIGWIPQGRDVALEQTLLTQILMELRVSPNGSAPPGGMFMGPEFAPLGP